MSHTTLAALIIDINRPAKEGSTYSIELRRRPEAEAIDRLNAGYALDPSGVMHEVDKVLQANFLQGVPIEFRSKTYETIAEALEAIAARRQEWE